ncbi:MAG TPA: hypothetical protein VFR10_11355 [bacterium]|nr:hypothetical protein [bacterium]
MDWNAAPLKCHLTCCSIAWILAKNLCQGANVNVSIKYCKV